MRTIWQSLAWKEWHEHKWKLVSMIAILWGVTLLALLDLERGTLFGIEVGLVVGIAPLAVFIGLGTAAGERSRGTLEFLQSLPVPMWQVALHKLAFGLMTVVVPGLMTIALVLAWTGCLDLLGIEYKAASDFADAINEHVPFKIVSSWTANTVLMLMLVGSSFYVWTIAAGANRKDEVSAGAVALASMTGWGLMLAVAWNLLLYFAGWPQPTGQDSVFPYAPLAVAGLATVPGGLMFAIEGSQQFDGQFRLVVLSLGVATITQLALATWFVRRFGHISDVEIRSPKAAKADPRQFVLLGPPRRSPLTAIAWKQFRESGPLALVGIAVIVSTFAVLFAVNDPHPFDFYGHLFVLFATVTASIGFAVAMILGIGVFFYDVSPGLNTFWRSRPIDPDMWFWTKYVSGLAIMIVAVYGLIVLVALPRTIQLAVHMGATPEDRSLIISRLADSSRTELLLYPVATIAVLASAVAMICLVRHAVYAAILSIAAMYISVLVGGLAWFVAGLLGWVELNRIWWEPTEMAAMVGLLFSIAVSTIVAWLAVRNDWGWKSRY